MARRRARNGRGTAYLEMAALVIEEMHLVGTHVDARFLVARESVIVVAVPNSAHDVDELLSPIVSLAMRRVGVAVELERVVLVAAGHDVPGGASAGHVIERRHGARQ